MPPVSSTTPRRAFLLLACGTVAFGLSARRAKPRHTDTLQPIELARRVTGLPDSAMREIARSPDTQPAHRVHTFASPLTPDDADALRRRAAQEHREGRSLLAAGWVVSPTEVALCRLAFGEGSP